MNAIINSQNAVIGFTSANVSEIEIAGAVAANGAPVNVKTYRVSASQANRAKIDNAMPSAIEHQHNGRVFYTLTGE